MNETNALQRMEPEGGGELIVHQPLPPPSLFGTADPAEVVARASRVAASLKEVIKAQGLISKISGKEYPRCEAWTLLGTMLGVFPVLVWTRAMENGWEARVEARTRDGAIVGAAEAQCLKTERNWGNRDDFALRSMAQTRATAKALRMPLGFVMTLGGFQATPAEEMDFDANVPRGTSATKGQKGATQQQLKPTEPKQATAKTRDWFLAEMRKRFDDSVILQFACDSGPPYALTPNETLEEWPLEHVPTTRAGLEVLVNACAKFMNVEPRTVGESTQNALKPSESDSDRADARADAENASNQAVEPQDAGSDENGEPVLEITGKLEQVAVKEGISKKGKWKRYGVRIGKDFWANSFSATLGKLAEADKGKIVRVLYREGERGNDLVGIEPV